MMTLDDHEMRLAICLARRGMADMPGGTVDSHDAPDIDGNINWSLFEEKVARHRLVPLVSRGMDNSGCHGVVVSGSADRIRKAFMANCARSLRMTEALARVLDRLDKAGIRALCFKGPVLALQAFGDPAMRQFDDIDLIIRRDEIMPAAALLMDCGCTPLVDMPERVRKAHVDAGWGYKLKSPDGTFLLELDSHIAPDNFPLHISIEELFSTSMVQEWEGFRFPTFSNTVLAVLLCAHAAKHSWERVSWIADIVGLARSGGFPGWDDFRRVASASGCLRIMRMGVLLMDGVMGERLPDGVSGDAQADRTAVRLVSRVVAGFGGRPVRGPAQFFYHIACRERIMDRAAYVLAALLQPTYSDWMFVRLPERLRFAYYPMRPFRLAFSLMVRLAHRLSRSRR